MYRSSSVNINSGGRPRPKLASISLFCVLSEGSLSSLLCVCLVRFQFLRASLPPLKTYTPCKGIQMPSAPYPQAVFPAPQFPACVMSYKVPYRRPIIPNKLVNQTHDTTQHCCARRSAPFPNSPPLPPPPTTIRSSCSSSRE